MNKTVKKSEPLFKAFIYVALITLAVLIIVPVAWVFLASVKQNSEFYEIGRASCRERVF